MTLLVPRHSDYDSLVESFE
jgi:hypothetical protein